MAFASKNVTKSTFVDYHSKFSLRRQTLCRSEKRIPFAQHLHSKKRIPFAGSPFAKSLTADYLSNQIATPVHSDLNSSAEIVSVAPVSGSMVWTAEA